MEQYFGNPENYFEIKKTDKKEEPDAKQQIEPENEIPDEKYQREEEEQKSWGNGLK
jgi:hypothetical protein